jgi:RimJ/RimL family protein N-acetyltransferase
VLVEASDADFAALIDGGAPPGLRLPDGPVEAVSVLEMLRALAAKITPNFAPAAWMLVEDGEIEGLLSITSIVVPGEVRIGYGVAETRRNRGVATRAMAAFVAWASDEPRLSVLHAETAVDNRPSLRVLASNGFVQVGGRFDDEDGALICWRRDTPTA